MTSNKLEIKRPVFKRRVINTITVKEHERNVYQALPNHERNEIRLFDIMMKIRSAKFTNSQKDKIRLWLKVY